MTEQTNKSPEKENSFKEELDIILNRVLTAENIDEYAETALSDVIELVGRAVDKYRQAPSIHFSSDKEMENAAFNYFGLNDIETILDHIASTARDIDDLSNVIISAENAGEVIVPPDNQQIPESKGGDFVERKTVPRLKTVLFILSKEFGLDVTDTEQVAITEGEVTANMIRKHSYYLVEAKPLNRSVLVCDEEGNATYIFDRVVLNSLGITKEELIRYSKSQINELIESHKHFGRRLEHSNLFVPRVISALKDPVIDAREEDQAEGKYLIPPAPEGVLSLFGVTKALDVSSKPVIVKALAELGDSIGEVKEYKFGSRRTAGYNPHQQTLIKEQLEKSGYYRRSPEGYANVNNLHERWGVVHSVIYKAIDQLGDSLGRVEKYAGASGLRPHYSPEQQQQIHDRLVENGALTDRAPDGYLSLMGMAREFGVDHSTVVKVVEQMKEVLGNVPSYKFYTAVAPGFSPAQQELIFEQLDKSGLVVDRAPEGVLTVNGLLELPEFQPVRHTVIYKAIEALSDNLGLKTYRFGKRGRIARGLDPEQQQKVLEYLKNRGALDKPPEGYETVGGIAANLSLVTNIIKSAATALQSEIGEVKSFDLQGESRPFYSPAQQEIIRSYLEKKGYFDLPPEGYLPASQLAQKLGIQHPTLNRARQLLADRLGPIGKYKFHKPFTEGYSPNQQEIFRQHFENIGFFNLPPDGYASIGGMRDEWGTAYESIRHAIEILGESLGDVRVYRFNSAITEGYSPRQQQMIREQIERSRAN